MMRTIYVFLIVVLSFSTLSAQSERQVFSSPLLLKEKEHDIKWYNALYTVKGKDGFEDYNSRSTFLTSFLQYGFGDSPNFNWGVDLILRSNVLNDDLNSSPFEALKFNNESTFRFDEMGDTIRNEGGSALPIDSKSGLVHFGPKVKFVPFKSIPNLAFQQTIYFSINKEVDSRNIFVSQLAYYHQFNSWFNVYAEASLWLPREMNSGQWYFLKSFWGFSVAPGVQVYAMNTFPYEYGGGIKLFTGFGLEIDLFSSYLLSWEPWILGDEKPFTVAFGLRKDF